MHILKDMADEENVTFVQTMWQSVLFQNCNKNEKETDEKMAIKGAEGKEGVVYLSVDSSMKENNGQQLLPCLPLSLLESIKELL